MRPIQCLAALWPPPGSLCSNLMRSTQLKFQHHDFTQWYVAPCYAARSKGRGLPSAWKGTAGARESAWISKWADYAVKPSAVLLKLHGRDRKRLMCCQKKSIRWIQISPKHTLDYFHKSPTLWVMESTFSWLKHCIITDRTCCTNCL